MAIEYKIEELNTLFLGELVRLVDDYFRCNDSNLKDEIYKDIVLLSDAVRHLN